MPENVATWLTGLGLSQYVDAFEHNAIDWQVLAELDHDVLKDIGVSAAGHRLQILKAVKALEPDFVTTTSVLADQSKLDRVGAPSGEAERRQLTVMFCDLVGSTELSQSLDPERLREINRSYQDVCTSSIERYEGYVARYMGDGVLAYFGYPQAHEDDAERAIHAALDVIESVAELDTDTPDTRLEVRVGIATGPVVVGDLIGEGASQESAVVGETPNLAARLQALAEPNSVLISAGTRRLVGKQFEYADLGETRLRGFREPVRVWRVEREALAESRFAARDFIGTSFVGRVPELDLLVERWSMTRAGEGQVVLVSGEPGIGKSRLVEVMREHAMSEPHLQLRYQCSPYHTNSALYPVITQLERAAEFEPSDGAQDKLDKLEALLAKTTDLGCEITPLMASLLSIPGESRYGPLDLTPQQRKDRTLAALTAQLVAMSQQQPLLFIFEDAHWIDPTTHELLERVIACMEEMPLFMIVTQRPGALPSWADTYGHVTAVSLSRLGRDKVRELVRLIAGENLPRKVLERIAERTDGVPLFIEELTKSVIEAGVDSYAEIPESLQASLLARFDRLGDIKELAQIGATIGREFTHELLASVTDRTGAALDEGLERLVQSDLIFRRGEPPNATYVFKHALIQDTAYNTLLEPRRRALHVATARAIEAVAPDTLQTAPELVAYHYARAGESEIATDLWIEAGRRSIQRSAYAEAIAQLSNALEALGVQPPTEMRLRRELAAWVSLGPALMVDKGPSSNEVENAYRKAAELSEQVGDREQQFRSMFGHWHLVNIEGHCSKAKDIAQKLIDQCRHEEASDHHLQAHHAYWSTAYSRGDLAACREHTERGFELYDRDRHADHKSIYAAHDPGVCCYMFSAWMNVAAGNTDSALRNINHCLTLSAEIEHPYSSTTAFWGASKLYHFLQQPQQTIRYATEGLELARTFGVKAWIPMLELTLWAARGTDASHDDLRVCIDGVNDARRRWFSAGAGTFTSWFGYELAKLHLRRREHELALDELMTALNHCERREERWLESELHRLVAKAQPVPEMRSDVARVQLEQALAIADSQGAGLFRLRAAKDLAQWWCGEGERQRAHQLLLPAYTSLSEGLDSVDLQDARALLQQLS